MSPETVLADPLHAIRPRLEEPPPAHAGETTLKKLGLVTNPQSQYNRRHGTGAVESVVNGAPDILHAKLTDMRHLPGVLSGFAADGVDILAVNGGDGTVQGVLTELLANRPFSPVPPLAILPGGMTNTIADNVGLRGSPAQALSKLIAAVRRNPGGIRRIERPIIRVENGTSLPPQYGMLFGTAGIVRAIEVCRDEAHGRGLKADWANAATLVGLLVDWLFFGGRSEVFRGDEMAISLDGGPAERGAKVVVLATTVDRMFLRSRPFWNTDSGPIKFTAIAHPPKHLLRRVYKLLYGGPNRTIPEATYQSRGAHRVVLEMACPFMVDGQVFHPENGQSVRITAEEKVSFVQIDDPSTMRPLS